MKPETVLRWIARVWGIATALLILAFVFGGREHIRMTSKEAVGFLFFPVGVIAGFGVDWRREWAGGLITVGGIALFFLRISARDGRFRVGPYFLLMAAPRFLHIASSRIQGGRRRTMPPAE